MLSKSQELSEGSAKNEKHYLKTTKDTILSKSQEYVDTTKTSKTGIEARQWLTAPNNSINSKSMESLRTSPMILGSSPPTGWFFFRWLFIIFVFWICCGREVITIIIKLWILSQETGNGRV